MVVTFSYSHYTCLLHMDTHNITYDNIIYHSGSVWAGVRWQRWILRLTFCLTVPVDVSRLLEQLIRLVELYSCSRNSSLTVPVAVFCLPVASSYTIFRCFLRQNHCFAPFYTIRERPRLTCTICIPERHLIHAVISVVQCDQYMSRDWVEGDEWEILVRGMDICHRVFA